METLPCAGFASVVQWIAAAQHHRHIVCAISKGAGISRVALVYLQDDGAGGELV
jgi:hypothetical protein